MIEYCLAILKGYHEKSLDISHVLAEKIITKPFK